MRVGKNFDHNKPINLVVFNHGWDTTAQKAFSQFELDRQLNNAPANTVFFIPEWQASPDSESYAQGNFGKPGYFSRAVQDAFNQVPALRGKTWADVKNVDIFSHSAGHAPTATEMADANVSARLKSLTLLDSHYGGDQFDGWVADRIKAFGPNSFQYNDIYCGSDRGQSTRRGNHATSEMAYAELRRRDPRHLSSLATDYDNPGTLPDYKFLADHPLYFKNSTYQSEAKQDPHMGIVHAFPGIILRAMRYNRDGE
jgi:hypothetical protein